METLKQKLVDFFQAHPDGVTIHQIAKHLYSRNDEKTLAKTRVTISRSGLGGKVKKTYNSPTYKVSDDTDTDSKSRAS